MGHAGLKPKSDPTPNQPKMQKSVGSYNLQQEQLVIFDPEIKLG